MLAIKVYTGKSKINSAKKRYLQRELNMGPFVIHSNAFLTELTWQVLIEGYLTLLVHHLTFGLG